MSDVSNIKDNPTKINLDDIKEYIRKNTSNSNNYIIIGPYDILEPFPAKGSAGQTDEYGVVQLEIVTKSPLELQVLAENQLPWKGQIAITSQGDVEITPYSNESLMQVTTAATTTTNE